jgi:hypothetical protein
MYNCLPWFLLKRSQAELILEHQETTTPDFWQRGPGLRTPENVLEFRDKLRERMHDLNRRGPRPDLEKAQQISEVS